MSFPWDSESLLSHPISIRIVMDKPGDSLLLMIGGPVAVKPFKRCNLDVRSLFTRGGLTLTT